MTKTRGMVSVAACVTLGVMVVSVGIARGEDVSFQALAQRLPASSNAVVAVNAAKVLESPYCKQQHWAERAAEAWARQPVMIPSGARKLIMAAEVSPSTMNSVWELSLIEMDKVPSVQDLAAAEGGHIDRVWDKDAVASPINAYIIPMGPTVLASITPASRATIVRWVRQPVKAEGYVESPYIKKVIGDLSGKTDIVMAMDLDGAWGVPDVRRFLRNQDLPEVPPEKVEETAKVLATMQGITLEIAVGENVTGRARVDFGSDTAILTESAKPIMVAVLAKAGMSAADVKGWTFNAGEKQVSMEGSLSADGLRELLGLVQSPIPVATVAGTSPAKADGTTAAPASPVEASQRYYKSVDMCIRGLQQSESTAMTGMGLRNAAKRIQQLPILGVDPALVEWGALVSTKLSQANGVLSVGQVEITARAAGVSDPEYSNDANSIRANYAAQRNANNQRRQAASEQRAQSYRDALAILNEAAGTSQKVRAEMVAKYNAEF